MADIVENGLVLYKDRPARVLKAAGKIEIEDEQGRSLKVRPKDIFLLHPGPIQTLSELKPKTGEVEIAWEILCDQETTNLEEIAELAFDEVTPSTIWASWELVLEGLHFYGEASEIKVRNADEVAQEQARRAARNADEQAWGNFIDRIRNGQVLPAETENLVGVERLAYGKTAKSRVLQELGRGTTPENAHSLLLRLGHWDDRVNPYPQRFDLALEAPNLALPELPEEERLDLTHLPAYAIDDEGSNDPDDAISIDGDRLWIHVADVAALVTPKSPLDLEARARGGNLYLPEGIVPMLPPKATDILGLGLNETSPALSFCVTLNHEGAIDSVEIHRATIKVTRMSYDEANLKLEEEPFASIYQKTQLFGDRRRSRGSARINLPEVKISVVNDEIKIRPLASLKSRDMVTDAMLMAGEAAARFALEHSIPFPFTTQAPPDSNAQPEDMAAMFAFRKQFKRSQTKTQPEPHTGLGLDLYTRTTSPLRRYMDLVAHQQIRAFLRDEELASSQEITERVGAAEAMVDPLNRTERSSNKHWTLVFLKRNPQWEGTGILVDQRGKRGIVIIPELGLESQIQLSENVPLNSPIKLSVRKVNLPDLTVSFKVDAN